MPRLKLSCLSPFGFGPCVTTSGQVISGAGSPGQQVWIGSLPRSMSSPVSTISWQGAEPTVLRLHRHHGAQHRQHVERLAPAARRLGLAQEGQRLADVAQLVRLAVHAPGDALDRAEQIDQHRQDASEPTTFSNSTAGPFSASRRVWISVISSTGETGALTRTSRPVCSSRAMKSRSEA